MQNLETVKSRDESNGCRFERIIGRSAALEALLEQVDQVAGTGSSVLLEGETGTGKELIARAIHNMSPRCGHRFLTVNCAAIPLDLLESELFGHERGAFTGAMNQKPGRFEMADQGTLFLDEIGDMPLVLQPKLLRVLQEHEIERLGGTATHRIDVRVIAATNRDLGEMVRLGHFRSDLYYRLNVFPIMLPPLRERREDIVPLLMHFVDVFSSRMGKRIEHIPLNTLSSFVMHSWPGNVRELQNLVERAVILSRNGILVNPFTPAAVQKADAAPAETLQTAVRNSERALIMEALETVNWVISGPAGAAARLGLKRTTLLSKMKQFGIVKPRRDLENATQTTNSHPPNP